MSLKWLITFTLHWRGIQTRIFFLQFNFYVLVFHSISVSNLLITQQDSFARKMMELSLSHGNNFHSTKENEEEFGSLELVRKCAEMRAYYMLAKMHVGIRIWERATRTEIDEPVFL